MSENVGIEFYIDEPLINDDTDKNSSFILWDRNILKATADSWVWFDISEPLSVFFGGRGFHVQFLAHENSKDDIKSRKLIKSNCNKIYSVMPSDRNSFAVGVLESVTMAYRFEDHILDQMYFLANIFILSV